MYPSHLGPGDRVEFVEPPAEGPILGYSHEAIAALRRREQDEQPIGERINLYGYVLNNPISHIDPSGLSVLDEANRRRGHGPWADSAQHCWAACYFGVVYGLGNIAALIGDIGEIACPSSDSWRDIKAQHYGAGLGNDYSWVYLLGLAKHTPEDYCDAACNTWP